MVAAEGETSVETGSSIANRETPLAAVAV